MLKYLLFGILYGLLQAGNSIGSVSSCTGSDWLASDVDTLINPNNPNRGDNFDLYVNYTLSENIDDGNVFTNVKLNGFTVFTDKNNLCGVLKDGTTPCPLNSGRINSFASGMVPTNFPSGKMTITTTWKTLSNQNILCYEVNTNLT